MSLVLLRIMHCYSIEGHTLHKLCLSQNVIFVHVAQKKNRTVAMIIGVKLALKFGL
jgi:hypothetical protein